MKVDVEDTGYTKLCPGDGCKTPRWGIDESLVLKERELTIERCEACAAKGGGRILNLEDRIRQQKYRAAKKAGALKPRTWAEAKREQRRIFGPKCPITP